MERGRSISGEVEGTFSVLNLVENVLVGQNVESRVRRIEEILLLRSDVRRALGALNDADPATMKAISDWLTGVLSFSRRTDVALDCPDFPSLQPILSTYRPIINTTFENIQLRFGSSFEDLSTKITNLEIEGGSRRSLTQLFQDHVHVFSPTVNRTVRHLSTHHPLFSETHHHSNLTTTRHIRHLRVEHPVNFEQHHHYTVKRGSAAALEYTLDGATGAVVLKKDGVAVRSKWSQLPWLVPYWRRTPRGCIGKRNKPTGPMARVGPPMASLHPSTSAQMGRLLLFDSREACRSRVHRARRTSIPH